MSPKGQTGCFPSFLEARTARPETLSASPRAGDGVLHQVRHWPELWDAVIQAGLTQLGMRAALPECGTLALNGGARVVGRRRLVAGCPSPARNQPRPSV